ncbi:MAG: thiamine-phosphate kinase [Candidatus Tectomicrobia bacterium]|uniref:Thiamine-monophosphate kinase n=1 Tax=Tectimicrobiota bacterium TaxID=2528274 RepID=A0A937VZE7_UNCTE|nr:thiamine-phosphate kinase [Candidatus Tectomicrobia bacterium]
MRIGELGEFALIDRLQQRLQGAVPSQVRRGIGDDCAVLRPGPGMDLLVTTDTQEEGVHFRRDWSTPEDIGWRCLAVNVSDIAAMGGTPLGAVVALSVPATLEVAFLEALYDGLQALASAYDCPVIGGNISKAVAHLTITITVLGEVPAGHGVYRSGAQVGDDIWVTGELGSAKAGLEALLHANPALASAEATQCYRRPRPRLREAQYLRQQGQLHSLIDISDGLSSDLAHICTESRVAAQLEAALIPISTTARQVAHALGQDPLLFALHGGEDFELCLTAPAGMLAAIQPAFSAHWHCPLVRVGTIQAGHGVMLHYPDGTRQPLQARGYDHFRPHTGEA